MLGGYLPGRSWLHRMPAGAKLAALALATLAVLPIEDWRLLAIALGAIAAAWACLGGRAWERLPIWRPILPMLLVVGLLQVWAGGIEAGAVVVLRLAAMVLLADLVAATTTLTAMMEAIAPVLAPLRHLGLSPKRLALGVALVLRFVPVMLDGWRAREEAWRARSGRRVPLRLVASFLADAMRLADQVGEALDARGFDAGPRRPADG